MSEVTKADINRIYDQLDPMGKDIATIKTTLELLPKLPERPCFDLKTHLANHRTTTRTWKSSAIQAVVHVAELAVVALVTYVIIKRNGG